MSLPMLMPMPTPVPCLRQCLSMPMPMTKPIPVSFYVCVYISAYAHDNVNACDEGGADPCALGLQPRRLQPGICTSPLSEQGESRTSSRLLANLPRDSPKRTSGSMMSRPTCLMCSKALRQGIFPVSPKSLPPSWLTFKLLFSSGVTSAASLFGGLLTVPSGVTSWWLVSWLPFRFRFLIHLSRMQSSNLPTVRRRAA